MTANRTVRWTLTSGKEIEVRISVTRKMVARRPINADGDIIEIGGTTLSEYQTIEAYLDASKVDEAYIGQIQPIKPKVVNGVTVVAILGTKLGLTAERLESIEGATAQATAEAEADPDVMTYRARVARGEQAEAEYEAHVRRVEDMMTLGGKTY